MDLIVAAVIFICVLVLEFVMEKRAVKLPISIPTTLSKKAFIAFLFGFGTYVVFTERIPTMGQKLILVLVTLFVLLAANIALPHGKD